VRQPAGQVALLARITANSGTYSLYRLECVPRVGTADDSNSRFHFRNLPVYPSLSFEPAPAFPIGFECNRPFRSEAVILVTMPNRRVT
jgi:hypothetical protein